MLKSKLLQFFKDFNQNLKNLRQIISKTVTLNLI